jgi:hypothetical protein
MAPYNNDNDNDKDNDNDIDTLIFVFTIAQDWQPVHIRNLRRNSEMWQLKEHA